MDQSDSRPSVAYRLCPRCFRATPRAARETYCPNDGWVMLEACPGCGADITSPYGRYCPTCGHAFGETTDEGSEATPE